MSGSQRRLRVGLVGCGAISENHVRAYRALAPRAQVVICCDTDVGRAQALAAQAGGAATTANVTDVLSRPDVDAVDLCTPPHLHADVAVAAANAGKHVICQKPLARTLSECDAMIEAARRAAVVLYHAEMNRASMPTRLAADAVRDGRIGALVGLSAVMAFRQGERFLHSPWRKDPAMAGGGQLLDAGIHWIDMLRQVGGEVAEVCCYTAQFFPEMGSDDTSALALRFSGGHIGTLFSSMAAGVQFPGPHLVAYGTGGSLTIGAPGAALVLDSRGAAEPEVLWRGGDRGFDDLFTAMIRGFVEAALDGVPNPSPPEEGRENMRVVFAAYESARQRRSVRLAELPALTPSESNA